MKQMTRRLKKTLALMLAVIMICPQYAFPVSAEELTTAAGEEIITSDDAYQSEEDTATTDDSGEASPDESEEIEEPVEETGVISQESFDENNSYVISEGGEYTLEAGISGWIRIDTTEAVTIIGTGCDPADKTTAYIGLSITGTVDGIDLTIKNLYITSGNSASGYNDGTYYNILNFQGAGNKLTLAGTNDLEAMTNGAAIHVPSTAELTIDEAEEGGILYLYKSGAWTGIGGNGYELNGKITFNGGTIFAKGTKMGALIGSGAEIESGVPGDIIINGGTMNLLANARGAAIGTGASSASDNSGDVYLNGGSVNINVDFSGSAIGLGNKDTGVAGNLYVKGGSLRIYIDQNAISNWGIDEAGVNPIAVTANMTNGESAVYMVTVPTDEADDGIYTVKVDGAVYYAGGLHTYKYVNESFVQGEQADISNTTTNWVAGDDTNLYLYLTGEDHTLNVNGVKYNAVWNSETESFTVEEKVLDPSISWYNTNDTEFVLTTAEQLKGFASIVNGTSEDIEQDNFAGKTVKLGADIAVAEDGLYNVIEDVTYGNPSWPVTTDQYVLQEDAPIWTPIGSGTATGNSNATTANAFAGTFDGDGYTINGIYTGTKDATSGNTGTVQGLFGVVTGTVKNVTVTGCITGKIVVGGIVASLNGGVIENCINNAVVFTDGGTTPAGGKEDGLYKGGAVGGIAGFAAGTGSIIDCVNNAVVTCANSAQGGRVGGILGLIDSRNDAISVSRCANTGDVSGYQYVGGIMGMNYAKTSPIDSCYNTGKITAAGSQKVHAGGIVGQFNCQVTNCYNTGEIHLSKTFGDQFNYVGGIAGDYDYSARNGKVINCYSIGEVTCASSPSSATHSLDSVLGDGPLSNCYYLDEIVVSYMKKSSAVSKTADEMKSVALVAALGSAFNLDADETINGGYPVLKWQGGRKLKEFAILTQPENVTEFVGKKAVFTVEADGEELTYQWQYKNSNAKTWYNSGMTGADTDTLTVPVTMARDGQSYRCIVTDSLGNQEVTAAVILYAKQVGVSITAQPDDYAGQPGDYAIFAVAATGEGLTYQWQYRNSGAKTWYNSGMTGADTDTLTVPVTMARNGQQYRCIVTDADGNQVISNAAILSIAIVITVQPEDYECQVGENAVFTVEATGNNLTYQWQYRNSGAKTWYNSGMAGADTDTLTVPVTMVRNGQQYRCIITDTDANTEISNAAVIIVIAEE